MRELRSLTGTGETVFQVQKHQARAQWIQRQPPQEPHVPKPPPRPAHTRPVPPGQSMTTYLVVPANAVELPPESIRSRASQFSLKHWKRTHPKVVQAVLGVTPQKEDAPHHAGTLPASKELGYALDEEQRRRWQQERERERAAEKKRRQQQLAVAAGRAAKRSVTATRKMARQAIATLAVPPVKVHKPVKKSAL
jgi:hypothetical protein